MVRKVLKEKYRQAIIDDTELQGKIAKKHLRSNITSKRWALISHEMLLHSLTLEAIREFFNLPDNTILTEELETKTTA